MPKMNIANGIALLNSNINIRIASSFAVGNTHTYTRYIYKN